MISMSRTSLVGMSVSTLDIVTLTQSQIVMVGSIPPVLIGTAKIAVVSVTVVGTISPTYVSVSRGTRNMGSESHFEKETDTMAQLATGPTMPAPNDTLPAMYGGGTVVASTETNTVGNVKWWTVLVLNVEAPFYSVWEINSDFRYVLVETHHNIVDATRVYADLTGLDI